MTPEFSQSHQISPSVAFFNLLVGLLISSAVLVFMGHLIDVSVEYTDAILCTLSCIPVGIVVLMLVQKIHGFSRVILWAFSQGSAILLIHLIIGSDWENSVLLWGVCYAVNMILTAIIVGTMRALLAMFASVQQQEVGRTAGLGGASVVSGNIPEPNAAFKVFLN